MNEAHFRNYNNPPQSCLRHNNSILSLVELSIEAEAKIIFCHKTFNQKRKFLSKICTSVDTEMICHRQDVQESTYWNFGLVWRYFTTIIPQYPCQNCELILSCDMMAHWIFIDLREANNAEEKFREKSRLVFKGNTLKACKEWR